MFVYKGKPLGIVERTTLLNQVDLQNIFDRSSEEGNITIYVVVRPTSPTSSFFDVYHRMSGEWLCMGGMLDCLTKILDEYGPEKDDS